MSSTRTSAAHARQRAAVVDVRRELAVLVELADLGLVRAVVLPRVVVVRVRETAERCPAGAREERDELRGK